MGKQFSSLEAAHCEFILRQHIFFTGSAAAEGRVNVSPKDTASLRILSPSGVAYLDETGSGNETAAHLRSNGRLTLMFCSFEQSPLILRLYGQGRVLPRGTAGYTDLLASAFANAERPGSRQMIVLDIDLVQTSCGFGVPFFRWEGDRPALDRWAESKGPDGIRDYWHRKNAVSIDGLPTGIGEGEPH